MSVLFNKSHRPILMIMAAVMIWGSLHALGAYLFEYDYRKPLIVCGFLLAFLGAWAALLAIRSRHQQREKWEAMDTHLNDSRFEHEQPPVKNSQR